MHQPATHIALNAASKRGAGTVYRYIYNAIFSNIPWGPRPGVAHSSEVPLVWGNLPPGSTADEVALSQYIQTAWANFAKTLDPGTGWVKVTDAGNDQLALNALTVAAAKVGKPAIKPLMGNYGGAGRCYPVLDAVYGALSAIRW